jgi:hypothetical protein
MPGCNVAETAAARARCVAYLTVGCSTLASMTVLLMQAIPMLLGWVLAIRSCRLPHGLWRPVHPPFGVLHRSRHRSKSKPVTF